MARIRTIKPEFWEDEVIGCLSRDARLLFIATWNIADDEGLLRWSPPYLKASAFMYDAGVSIKDVERLMAELTESGLIHDYRAGKAQQPFAYVVGFHKHQRINRPSPSRLTPPPTQEARTKELYGRRDGWRCHLCGTDIDHAGYGDCGDFTLSLDHIVPVSSSGTDYPSNIKAAHQTCNKGRGNRSVSEYQALVVSGKTVAQLRYPERFTDKLTEPSRTEEEGEQERIREQEGKGLEGSPSAPRSAPEVTNPEANDFELNDLAGSLGLDWPTERSRWLDWRANASKPSQRNPKDPRAAARNWLRNPLAKSKGPTHGQSQQPGRTGRIAAASKLLRRGVGPLGDAPDPVEPGLPGRENDGRGMGATAGDVLRIAGASVGGRTVYPGGNVQGPAGLEVLSDDRGNSLSAGSPSGSALEGFAKIGAGSADDRTGAAAARTTDGRAGGAHSLGGIATGEPREGGSAAAGESDGEMGGPFQGAGGSLTRMAGTDGAADALDAYERENGIVEFLDRRQPRSAA